MKTPRGWQTSEGQITAVLTAVLNLLVIYGVANSEQVEGWMTAGLAVIGIIPSIVYVFNRTSLKRNDNGNE